MRKRIMRVATVYCTQQLSELGNGVLILQSRKRKLRKIKQLDNIVVDW